MTPNETIARNLGAERSKAGLSLSQLAHNAGIAKSTLSQLESGNGNPSIETLWALANALDIPVSRLFEQPARQTRLVRAGEARAIYSGDTRMMAALLASSPPAGRWDLYIQTMQKNAVLRSDPHQTGTVEHLLVQKGRLKAGPQSGQVELEAGDYYSFPADQPHSYEALEEETVVITIMESR
ncbi:helix-turn-helix domain-containing protein [Kiloniella sp. b19]|uniref:helix-turn-helix domain-containing protein n=1 Tax=Kiloniella sp. GXU_MW_B19 TaxID=3141326 RepID=UPI0031D3F8EE